MFNFRIAISLASLFFILGLATLADYGVNWDAVSHLARGQAYLHYYLTGKNDYKDLPEWNSFRQKNDATRLGTVEDSVPRQRLYFQNVSTIFYDPDIPKDDIPRISIYQNVDRDLNYVKEHYDFGHPHISDVLSSVFNFVLFQKLGFINDIDSYRVYGVFLAASLVGLVFWWTAYSCGRFAGIVAVLSLSVYPLFWAESHFNTEKDVPETVFWSFVLFSVWRGVTTRSWKWILVSGGFFGLALGTKFNALFLVFVILPWLFVHVLSDRKLRFYRSVPYVKFLLKQQGRLLIAAPIALLLGLAMVTVTWPYFWTDPIAKTSQIVDFYRSIGLASSVDPRFLGPFGINTYPAQWILYTTPLVILFLAGMGIVSMVVHVLKGKNYLSLFFLLWLAVPMARVTWPGTNIYGGVRQIMEYIPALAIIAGMGGIMLRNWVADRLFSSKLNGRRGLLLASVLVLSLFIPIIYKLIQIHPNENVYFNPLIGGLQGARVRGFPGWGVSFGAPYREAVKWVNNNAKPGAKLTLGYEILSNIPGIFIRPDIDYKSSRSGYLRSGEYVISLRFDGVEKRSYFDAYLEKMLDPVYQIVVDGVPILKIWVNDQQYLRPEWRKESILENIEYKKVTNGLLFDLGKVVKLSRLEALYNEFNCRDIEYGYLMISKDGKIWERVPGVLPEEVRIKALGRQPEGGKFIEPFVGQEARYINFILTPPDACVTNIKSARLYHFK